MYIIPDFVRNSESVDTAIQSLLLMANMSRRKSRQEPYVSWKSRPKREVLRGRGGMSAAPENRSRGSLRRVRLLCQKTRSKPTMCLRPKL